MRDAVLQFGVWPALFADSGPEYLRGMWARCSQNIPECDRVPPIVLERFTPVRHGDWLLVPLGFPPPSEITEAYFGAVAVRPGKRRWIVKREAPRVRYILLELGLREDGSSSTVLGEWSLVAHMNYGDGPSPNLPDFLKSVAAVLDARVSSAAVFVRASAASPDRGDS
jgi:hypothetical protein